MITRIIEIVVHGEDILRALGISHAYSATYIGYAIAYLAKGRYSHRYSGGKQHPRALTLSAADTSFSIGNGPLIKGPAVALLLAASGRSARLEELTGPGASQLIASVPKA